MKKIVTIPAILLSILCFGLSANAVANTDDSNLISETEQGTEKVVTGTKDAVEDAGKAIGGAVTGVGKAAGNTLNAIGNETEKALGTKKTHKPQSNKTSKSSKSLYKMKRTVNNSSAKGKKKSVS